MRHVTLIISCISASLLLSACGQKSMYYWGSYSSSLNSYYKNPGERDKFIESLSKNIEKAEAKNKVPPGLYAEYGFMMLETGATDQALVYFAKERDKWPESAAMMSKVIERLNKVSAASGQPAAAQAE